MGERLVRVDMVSQDGTLMGYGEMYMSLFFYEEGFRQQIVDRQTFCEDGWQGKYDVRVKELTVANAKKSGLKAVVVPKKLFAGYTKTDNFLNDTLAEDNFEDDGMYGYALEEEDERVKI